MDSEISAVLDHYHAMIAAEKAGQVDGGPQTDGPDRRLRAIGPNSGQLINIMAKNFQSPTILEIGTSFGYSGIWLAAAARESGGRVITIEHDDYKSAFAYDMSVKAGLDAYVDFKVGDALEIIEEMNIGFDFVLLDLWKDLYTPCLELFYPKLNPGAIVVADNMISSRSGEGVRLYGQAVRQKKDMTSLLLPVGSGLEVSRYEPADIYPYTL